MHRLRVQSMQVQEPDGRPVDPHDDSIPRTGAFSNFARPGRSSDLELAEMPTLQEVRLP
jgi:hypothetical protein